MTTIALTTFDLDYLKAWWARVAEHKAGAPFRLVVIDRSGRDEDEPPLLFDFDPLPACEYHAVCCVRDAQGSDRTLTVGGHRAAFKAIDDDSEFQESDYLLLMSDEAQPAGDGWLKRVIDAYERVFGNGVILFGRDDNGRPLPFALFGGSAQWAVTAKVAGDGCAVPRNWRRGGAIAGERDAMAELERRIWRAAFHTYEARELGCDVFTNTNHYAARRDDVIHEYLPR